MEGTSILSGECCDKIAKTGFKNDVLNLFCVVKTGIFFHPGSQNGCFVSLSPEEALTTLKLCKHQWSVKEKADNQRDISVKGNIRYDNSPSPFISLSIHTAVSFFCDCTHFPCLYCSVIVINNDFYLIPVDVIHNALLLK